MPYRLTDEDRKTVLAWLRAIADAEYWESDQAVEAPFLDLIQKTTGLIEDCRDLPEWLQELWGIAQIRDSYEDAAAVGAVGAYLVMLALAERPPQINPRLLVACPNCDLEFAPEDYENRGLLYPVMLAEQPLAEQVRVPQTPETGLGGIIGKWPGDETDEEINRELDRPRPAGD